MVLSGAVLLLGGLILFLSLVRAGWEVTALNNEGDRLKTESIFFEVPEPDGGMSKRCYKIPRSAVLPDQPAYRLKEWRDFLWFFLADDGESKFKMAILIADKRMGETIQLGQKTGLSEEDFLEAAAEAVDWLLIANNLAKTTESKNQIAEASLAYRHEVEKAGNKWGGNSVEYLELVQKLKSINDQATEKFKKN